MDKQIKSIGIRFAAMIFFLMAIVGAICGQTPATISFRAFLGAAVAYWVTSFAGYLITHILVNEALRSKLDKLFSDQAKPKEPE